MIIETNVLSSIQKEQMIELESVCRREEQLNSSISLSNELNYDPEIPCFFLIYHHIKLNPNYPKEPLLIACLSLFIPFPGQAEVSAYTRPEYRQQAYFTTLMQHACHILGEYKIEDLLFVHEAASQSASATLKTFSCDYDHSEYLLTLPKWPGKKYIKPTAPREYLIIRKAPSSKLTLLAALHSEAFKTHFEDSKRFVSEIFDSPETSIFILENEDTIISAVCVYETEKSRNLFGVCTAYREQKKGYARYLLSSLLLQWKSFWKPVSLEVGSNNPSAFNLYRSLGFEIMTQFDYTYSNIADLII